MFYHSVNSFFFNPFIEITIIYQFVQQLRALLRLRVSNISGKEYLYFSASMISRNIRKFVTTRDPSPKVNMKYDGFPKGFLFAEMQSKNTNRQRILPIVSTLIAVCQKCNFLRMIHLLALKPARSINTKGKTSTGTSGHDWNRGELVFAIACMLCEINYFKFIAALV